MITLNLLPPTYKVHIKQASIYSALENFLAMVLIITIIVSISLITARSILQKNFYEEVTRASTIPAGKQELDTKIQLVNKKLKIAREVQDNFTKWSKFLIAISNLIPEHIQLHTLSINKEKATIAIEGQAQTRDDFLVFKKNLQESPIFSEIESPLSNLLKKRDVEFKLTAKLNLYHDN